MIAIKVDDSQVQKKLEKLAQYAVDRCRIMRRIAQLMKDAVEENFEKEGRPKWQPLSLATIKARQRKGYWPGKILQQRGRLTSSISSYSDNDKAVVGTNVVYAAIHQFGGKAGRGRKVKIPARPYLQLTDEDISQIVKAIEEYLKAIFGGYVP